MWITKNRLIRSLYKLYRDNNFRIFWWNKNSVGFKIQNFKRFRFEKKTVTYNYSFMHSKYDIFETTMTCWQITQIVLTARSRVCTVKFPPVEIQPTRPCWSSKGATRPVRINFDGCTTTTDASVVGGRATTTTTGYKDGCGNRIRRQKCTKEFSPDRLRQGSSTCGPPMFSN